MATTTLTTVAAGDETSIANFSAPAGSHWNAVNASDNGWIVSNVLADGWQRDLYNFNNPSLSGIISQIEIKASAIRNGSGYPDEAKLSIKIGAYQDDGVDGLPWGLLSSWTSKGWTFATNPDTGLAWTWTDINNLQAGIYMISGMCRYSYVVVTYTPITAPTVTLQTTTDIEPTIATGNGNITNLGGADATEHGHCWNTGGTPTVADSRVDNGAKAATGAFTSAVTGLLANTTYYIRAYARNSAGYGYSAAPGTQFTTDPTYGAINQTFIID